MIYKIKTHTYAILSCSIYKKILKLKNMFRDYKVAINNYYLPEPDYIKIIRDSCPGSLKKMQMSHEECRIMSFFLRMIRAERVLELGTLVGCSTAWIAHSLSGTQSQVVSVEKSVNNYNLASVNIEAAGLEKIVDLINNDAITVLESYMGKPQFDAVFIDAKKVEYCRYLELAKSCVRSGGLIIADNTLMINESIPEISTMIREFNLLVENDHDLISVILPTVAGMTIMIKK